MTNFDKILRNKLRDYDSPVPGDAWTKIQDSLPSKKRRPPFNLYFLGAISMMTIALLASSYYFIGNRKLQIPNTEKLHVSNNEIESITSQDLFNVKGSDDSKVNNLSSYEILPENDINNLSTKTAKNSNAGEEKFGYLKSKIVKYQTNAFSKKSIVVEDSNSDLTSSTYINNDLNQAVSDNSMTKFSLGVINNETKEAIDIKAKEKKLESLYLPYSDRVFGSDHSSIMEYISTTMKNHLSSMPCPTFVRKESKSSIETYYGSGLAFRNLEAKNIEKEGYLLLRKFTEEPIYSLNVGALYSTGWENGFELKVGINYSRIIERFTYENKNVIGKKSFVYYMPDYDAEYNETGKGKEIEELVPTPGTLKIVHHNKYEFVDIPLLCQYLFSNKSRFSFALAAGPMINISFDQDGKILDLGNQVEELRNTDLYKRNIGLSFQGSASLRYAINKRIQFIAEPILRYIPNSISTINNPLQQNYSILYLNTGLKYSL